MKKLLLLLSLIVSIQSAIAQLPTSCANMEPICTDAGLDFTAQTGVADASVTDPGNNYDCLYTQPNPTWYYFEISANGTIDMSLSAPSDIDFAVWGPFTDLTDAVANCGTYGVPVDCSFSGTANETPSIPNAQIGEVYVMLITNYANSVQDITLGQTGGTGATDCTILVPCTMDGLTATMTGCSNDPFLEFDMGGQVTFTDPPATGQLIVENCYGQQQVFNPPFTSPQAYTFTALPQDGATCDITAYFTDDPACTITTPMQAPPPITFFSSNCVIGGGAVNGSIEFTNPNNVGTSLVVSINDGTNTVDTTIFPPFTSPQAWSVSGLDPSATTYNIDYYFTDYVACVNSTSISCGCSADAGTSTASITGSGSTDFVLCENDEITLVDNGDWTAPDDFGTLGGLPYNPAIGWMIYDCPPTPGISPVNDPCFVTILSAVNTASDVNDGTTWWNTWAGNFTNNTAYIVPITLYTYDVAQDIYMLNTNCFDVGPATAVTYLDPITSTVVEDCPNGTVTVTVTGGDPALNGTDFTASNLLPATASFNNTTAGNNGDIVISGLQNGDMYSFDIVDVNGCPHTITGGPFVGLPTAAAGVDDTICGALSMALNATPSFGTGAWTGPAGVTFTNAASATSTVTVPSAGTYTLTWTETTAAGCSTSDDVDVTLSLLSMTDVVTPSSCGASDGEMVITGAGGVTPYQYSNDNGGTFQASGTFSNLSAGNYQVVVQDALGCTVSGTVTVTDVGGITINSITPTSETCIGNCDGSLSIDATGATQFSIDSGLTYVAGNVFSNLCAGDYNVFVQDAAGCVASGVGAIAAPDSLLMTLDTTNLLCFGECVGQIVVTPSGGSGGYSYSIDGGATTQPLATFSNLCAQTYNVVLEDVNGCQATESITLTEPPAMSWTVGVTDATCNGMCDGIINVIPAGGSGTYSYTWTPAAINVNQPLLLNLCEGAYGLTVTDGNGCTYDTAAINVGAPIAVSIDNIDVTDVLCAGDCNGTVTATTTGATEYSLDGVNYQPGATFIDLCAGTYTLYARDPNGCEETIDFVIQGPAFIDIQAYSDTTICIGGTASLSALATGGAGNYTYSWDSGETTQDISVSPATDQSYCVTATDDNGCVSPQACVLVSLNQALNLQAFVDATICDGDSAPISAFATGGDGGPYTYTWDQGVGIGDNHNVSPTVTTDYTVTVTDGCETPSPSATVTITVVAIPNISFVADTVEGCMPVTVNFNSVNVPAGSNCVWSFGDGGASTDCDSTTYVFTEEGCWDVSLNITTQEGCPSTASVPNYVCVHGYPTAQFTFGPQPTTILNTEIAFTNQSLDAASYNWTFDVEGVTTTDDNVDPVFTFPNTNPGTYNVCLEAISAEGCPHDTCEVVEIRDEMIVYVPNAFTPDGDAVNPTFFPVVSGIEPNTYEFQVFDRWGLLIFSSTTVGEGWDGTYKGLEAQTDVYVWKLIVKDQLKLDVHEYIGHVSLLR